MLIPALNLLITGHIVLICELQPRPSICLNGASNQCQWLYSSPSITSLLQSCHDSRRRKRLEQTDNGNTYLGCEHCVWSKITWCLGRKANRRPRKLRQLLGGPPAAQGVVCSRTLWDPLEMQAEKWRSFQWEKQTSPRSQPLPKRLGCWGWGPHMPHFNLSFCEGETNYPGDN